jgi:hypothetical protein
MHTRIHTHARAPLTACHMPAGKRYQIKCFAHLLADAIGGNPITQRLFWEISDNVGKLEVLVNEHEVLQLVHTAINDGRAFVTLGFIKGIPLAKRTGKEHYHTTYSRRAVRTGIIPAARAAIATAFCRAIDAGIESYRTADFILFGQPQQSINEGMIEYGQMTKRMASIGVLPADVH